MSFDTARQYHMQGVATGPGSEDFVYRASPGFASETLTGIVRREPFDPTGDVHANTIEIFVDKLQLVSPVIDADVVVIDSTEHIVVSAQDYRGGWLIRAVR